MTVQVIKLEKNDCPKCDAMRPMLESIEEELEALGVTLQTINTDDTPEAITKYNLMGVPVLVFERDGVEMLRIEGMAKPADIFSAVEFVKGAR